MKDRILFKLNNLKEELIVVEQNSEKISFFEKMGIKFTMPKKPIDQEYDKKLLGKISDELDRRWREEEGKFTNMLLDFFNITSSKTFTVKITSYGPLGNYDLNTNTIFINRHAKMDHLKIIKHELTHLLVEGFVQKHELDHTQKEYIVETLGTLFDILPQKASGIKTGH